MLSDEAHFTLDEEVNSQNCCIWGSERTFFVHENSLHSDYITVWCDFTADFILGPFFFSRTLLKAPRVVPSLVHVIAISFSSTLFLIYVKDSP